MVERIVPLNASVSVFSNYELDEAMKQAIADAFATLLADVRPEETLYVDAIETAVLGVPGVKSVIIDAPENIVCGPGEALAPGVVKVTAL